MAGRTVPQMQAALSQGEQQRTGKRFQSSLYDTIKMATGDTELQLLQVPIGVIGSGYTAAKTLLQTNARAAGTIPKGQMFEAHGVIPYLYCGAAAVNNATMLAIQLWMRSAMFLVKFPGGDDLIQERLDFVFNEQRQWLHVPTTAGDNIHPANTVTVPGYYKLNDKLKFAALDSYEIRIHNLVAVPAALNGFEITMRFMGFRKRLSS